MYHPHRFTTFSTPSISTMFCFLLPLVVLAANVCEAVREPLVAPYVDATRMEHDTLVKIHQQTGLQAVSLAFVLGGIGGCDPSWGGQSPLNDESIMGAIKAFQAVGGKVILSTGGAAGPYLETSCSSPAALAGAYKKALTSVGTTHLDIDIEASVSIDNMNEALKQLQSEMPGVTVSFTLMVQGDDYGLTDILGVGVIQSAANHGVQVDIVNAMSMEFGSKLSSWGEAVIASAEATHAQMKKVWPSKSDSQLYAMLGVTPMIGRNFNGKIFTTEHAQQLVKWAKEKKVGHIAFWSLGRDNGNCAGGGVSPDCSSIAQAELEFSKIFASYQGTKIDGDDHDEATTKKSDDHDETTTKRSDEHPTTRKPVNKDCSSGQEYLPHEKCEYYYWCYGGEAHLEKCGDGTIWDPKINSCNFKKDAHRDDCD